MTWRKKRKFSRCIRRSSFVRRGVPVRTHPFGDPRFWISSSVVSLSSFLLLDEPPPTKPSSSSRVRAAVRTNAILGIALDGASRCWSLGLMHAECSRRRPTCTGNDRSGLPASRLQLQRSSRVRCTRTPSTLCMHDSARMTQPARRTRSTTLTRLHVGASHLRADTENKIRMSSRISLHRES